LLLTAGDGKVIQVLWLKTIQVMEDIGLNTTKSGAIDVDLTFPCWVVKMNAPAVFAHQTEIEAQFFWG